MTLARRLTLTLAALAAVAGLTIPQTAAQASPAPIVVIFMENHDLAYITGHPALVPYEYALWKHTAPTPSEDFTAYSDVGTGSLPDYLAAVTGHYFNTNATGYKAGSVNAPSLWDQLTAAGISWGVYEEGMPATCSPVKKYNDTASAGQYIMGHNPGVVLAPVYTSAECQNVRPLSALPASLPAVSFIAPNLCDDMHGIASGSPDPFADCVTGSTALVQRSDAWLTTWVPELTGEGADVFITYDEGSGHLYAVETGLGVVAGSFTAATNHYGLLGGIEQTEGLAKLGSAAGAVAVPFPG